MKVKMEKRVLLGIRKKDKKKPIEENKKGGFFGKVVDYLKADSYLFAPLISPPNQHGFVPPKTTSFSNSTGMEIMDSRQGGNKRLVDKVMEYLKSDCYMYSPFFALQPTTSAKVQHRYRKRVTVGFSRRKLVKKDNQPTIESSSITVEDHLYEGNLPERSTSGQQKPAYKETAKHMVCPSCPTSSVSEKEILESQLKKLVVD